MNQKSAWYMQQRIRTAMTEDQDELLQGILEADETYVGGKPRRTNRRDDHTPQKRGRGTKKTPVLGIVQRGGKVKTAVTRDLSGKRIFDFIKESIDPRNSRLITDEYGAHNALNHLLPHAAINHREAYAEGSTHTNTIEGFWALLKRAWYGSHHHYTAAYMPLYVAETSWKYNERNNPHPFKTFMRSLFV